MIERAPCGALLYLTFNNIVVLYFVRGLQKETAVTTFKFPEAYKSTLLSLGRRVPYTLPKKLRGVTAPLILFNSGKHLYADLGFPRWYSEYDQQLHFLRYREYCGEGKSWCGMKIQHLGHKLGIHGGDATVRVTYTDFVFEITVVPCRLYFIVDFNLTVGLFMLNRPTVLPRTLLTKG